MVHKGPIAIQVSSHIEPVVGVGGGESRQGRWVASRWVLGSDTARADSPDGYERERSQPPQKEE